MVLIVVSDHNMKSDWVHFEVSKAIEYHRTATRPKLVGLKIGESEVTQAWIPSLFENHSIWDFVNWQDASWSCMEVKRLADQIRTLITPAST